MATELHFYSPAELFDYSLLPFPSSMIDDFLTNPRSRPHLSLKQIFMQSLIVIAPFVDPIEDSDHPEVAAKMLQLWEYVVSRYSEPHRNYHNLTHIYRAVGFYMQNYCHPDYDNYNLAFTDLQISNDHVTLLHGAENRRELLMAIEMLALFYHDIDYIPSDKDNEERSAWLARSQLLGLMDLNNPNLKKKKIRKSKKRNAQHLEASIDIIIFLILSTQYSLWDSKLGDTDVRPNGWLPTRTVNRVTDCDLSDFGNFYDIYLDNGDRVAQEFSFAGRTKVLEGRISFLRQMLSRFENEVVYSPGLPTFIRNRMVLRAKDNIKKEIVLLTNEMNRSDLDLDLDDDDFDDED